MRETEWPSRIQIAHLKYFVAVAEHLNFSPAAEELNIGDLPFEPTHSGVRADPWRIAFSNAQPDRPR